MVDKKGSPENEHDTEVNTPTDAPGGDAMYSVDNTASLDDVKGNTVYVELIGSLWLRHDPSTGRVKKHLQGAKFWVTKAEYDLLSVGFKPTLREASEDN